MTNLKNLFAGAAILTTTAGAAFAQDTAAPETATRIANGTQFGAWTVSCEALAVNETAAAIRQRMLTGVSAQDMATCQRVLETIINNAAQMGGGGSG